MMKDHSFDTMVSDGPLETPLASGRGWERFKIVEARDGQIAFYNSYHKHFLKMDGSFNVNGHGGQVDEPVLPSDWGDECFEVINVGDGKVGLYSRKNRRFMRISRNRVDGQSADRNSNDLPVDWVGERFILNRC